MSSSDDSARSSNMTIAVRVRPLLPKEIAIAEKENAPHPHCITVDHEHNTVIVEERRLTVDLRPYVETRGIFAMDYAFDESAKNTNIYVSTLRSQLIHAIKNNERLACFVFGQTGSGKSFTMLGDQAQHGLFSLAVRDILGYGRGMELFFSFYELFNGKAYDLLNERAALLALEDGKQTVHLKGLSEFLIEDEDAFLELMHQGSQMRSQGSTHANENSSRSHAVALLNLTKKTSKGTIKVMSRFTFIDLAGSERGRDTLNTQNERHKEGAAINRSLLAVKECVRALHSGNQHVPFRGSKLTQVLRESLSGKCATVMIAMVSPFYKHVEDSVNALKYTSMLRQATNSSNHVSPQVNTSLITNGGKEHHQAAVASGTSSPRIGITNNNNNTSINNNNNSVLSSPNSLTSNTLILSSISNESTTNNNTSNINNTTTVNTSYNEDIECCSKCGYPLYAEDGIAHSCPKSSIRCPHCQMGVMKRNFEAHLAGCPEALESCQFCRQEMKKRDIEKHENTVCPRSFAVCTQCQQKIQPKSAMQQHLAENCLAAKWMCPFCKIVTSKRNAEDHQTTCAARLVNCENCGFKVRSNHLKQHKRVCVGTRRLDEIMEQEVYSPKMLVPIGSVNNNTNINPNSNQKQQQYEFTKVVGSPSSGNSVMMQQQNLVASNNNNSQQLPQDQQQKVRGISKPPTLAHLKVATHPGLAALLENNNFNSNSHQQQKPQQQQQQHSPQQNNSNNNQKRKNQQEIDELVSKLPRSLSPGIPVVEKNNQKGNQNNSNNSNPKPAAVNHIQKNRQNAASNRQQQAQTARTTTNTTAAIATTLLENNSNTNRKNRHSPLPTAPAAIAHTARTPQPASTSKPSNHNNNNNSKLQKNANNNNNNNGSNQRTNRRSPSTPQQQILHHYQQKQQQQQQQSQTKIVNNNNNQSSIRHRSSSSSSSLSEANIPPAPPTLSPMHVSACQFCHEHFLDNVLQKHIEHECMNVRVPCPFSDAGCKHLVERRNLASHLNENVGQHLVLLHSFTQHVEAENVTLKQRLSELEHSKRQQRQHQHQQSSNHGNNNKGNIGAVGDHDDEDVAAASTSLMILQQQQQQMMSTAQIAAAFHQARLTKRNSFASDPSASSNNTNQHHHSSSSNNNPAVNSNNGKPKLKSTRQQLQNHNSSPSMTVEKKISASSPSQPTERFHTPNKNDSFRFINKNNNNPNADNGDDDDNEETQNKYNNDDSAFDDDDEDEDSLSGEIINQSSSSIGNRTAAAFAPAAIKVHAIPGRRSTSPPPMGLNELLSDDDENNNNNQNENSMSMNKSTLDQSASQLKSSAVMKKSSSGNQNGNSKNPIIVFPPAATASTAVADKKSKLVAKNESQSKRPNPHDDGVFDDDDDQGELKDHEGKNSGEKFKNNNNLRMYHNVSATSVRTTTSSNGAGNHVTRRYSKQPSEMTRLSADPLSSTNTNQEGNNNQKKENFLNGSSPLQVVKTNKNVVTAQSNISHNKAVGVKKK